mmetsp:Transcript_12110/g.29782  ORF Transcript_12110/g.29782 Transcript_12110/m.29782 type:complete len:687 (+) Transcript_12110:38-2098(+)
MGSDGGAATGDKVVESMSVASTNELRAKLGLKPLRVVSKEEKAARVRAGQEKRAAAAREAAEEQENEEIRERLAKMKKIRQLKKKVKGKSLGDSLAKATGTSAADWVKRSRKIEQSRSSAAARYAELDAEAEAEYSAKDLKGIKVSHNAEDFKEGQQVILTLQDKPLLTGHFDDAALNEEEDVLMNPEMALNEKYEQLNEAKAKARKPKYDVYGEDLNQNILPQYDEDAEKPKEKAGMRLGEDEPDSEEERQKRAARVRERLQNKGVGTGKKMYSLSSEAKLTSDYKAPEVRFKKKKKKKDGKKRKRKIRSTSTLDFLPEPSEEDRAAHHGSRQAGNTELAKKQAAQKRKVKRDADRGYLKALKKEDAKSFIMQSTNDDEEGEDFEYEDKFDVQLQEALKRARESGVKSRTRSKDKADKTAELAKAILQAPKESSAVKTEGEKKSDGIVLSATSEFCRGLEGVEEKEKASKMEVYDKDMKVEDLKPTVMDESVGATMDVDEEEEKQTEEGEASDQDDTVGFLHDEPLASGGLSAVLSLAKRRGMLDDQAEKAKEKDPAPNLSIEYPDEYGRPMTAKEAFRKLSHTFHGKAPGKQKKEKKMKRYLEELKGKRIGNVDDPTHTISKLKQQQKAAGQAYLVLDQKLTAEDREKLVKEAQRQMKRKRKKQRKKERAAALAKKNAHSSSKS